MKTVCFDLRALQIGHEHRGIGAHIQSVLEYMKNDPDIHYIFYCFDKNNPIDTLNIKTGLEYTIVTTPTINMALDSPKNILGIFKLIIQDFRTLKKYKPDTFIQFDFRLRLPRWSHTKKIVIGYDLIPLIMRNEYLPNVGFAWHHSIGKKAKLRSVVRSLYYRFRFWLDYKVYHKADEILCISQASASSFKELLKIDSKKIKTIPLAPVLPKTKPDKSVANKFKKPFLFYIGGTDSRKSIRDIVYAFNICKGRGLDTTLVFAGSEFREVDTIPDIQGRLAILRSPYKKDIHLAGFVTNAQKAGLYEAAHSFIFTSKYEGFGLPVIEAMAASCPVITYNNSSIPEAGGSAAVLVKTGDYVAIANAIYNLEDKKHRAKLIKEGLSQASKFTWEAYVAEFEREL